MTCETLLDAPVPHKFCASLQAAEQQALLEAADTSGVVLRVKSLRVEPNHIVVTGLIPSAALVFEQPSAFPGHLQPRAIGNLYLTWNSLLQADAREELGYLVLQTPIATEGHLPESEDDDSYWAALGVERTFHTLAPYSIGFICCACCNRPISQQRLLAIPTTRVCTNCQQKKEKK